MKKLSKYYEDLVLNPEANGFCMLKPGFAQYADEFEKLLAANGWKVINKCVKKFTRDEIENFYSCHKDKPFYNRLCDYMITDDCCCYSCYKNCKDPYKDMAEFKDKIRDQWGEDDMKNAMHSSDSKTNMKSETKLAFNKINESEEINEKLKIVKKEKTKHTLFPETKEELVKMIKEEIKKNGNSCSLNHIDVSKIKEMTYLFSRDYYEGYYLADFNGDISEWNVSNVIDMEGMFECSNFNGDLYYWDFSNLQCMTRMFFEADFTGDISEWNVSNVEDMSGMFRSNIKFNENINNWDVSNVENMESMFEDSIFNQPLNKWNVSKVTNMSYMFCNNKSFKQDISMWKINRICITNCMFSSAKLEEKYKPKFLQK